MKISKLLVFEYSSIIYNKDLISEGYNMLHSLLLDLDNITEFNVDYLLHESIKEFSDIINSNKILINEKICSWLEENSFKYDLCFFIAPEDDYIQYEITRILEKNDVIIIGSNSNASFICCSKFETYKHVDSSVLKIDTKFINLNNITENFLEKIKETLTQKSLILKPDNKASSEYVFHIKTFTEFKNKILLYKKNNIKHVLIQEYIEGKSVSISAINNKKELNILSINSQEINEINNKIKYKGCVVPIDHPLKEKIYKITKKIVESINGLWGFIGIDYIIQDNNIYFVEINSRLTTPYIILQSITNINLGYNIIKSVLFNTKENVKLLDNGIFYK